MKVQPLAGPGRVMDGVPEFQRNLGHLPDEAPCCAVAADQKTVFSCGIHLDKPAHSIQTNNACIEQVQRSGSEYLVSHFHRGVWASGD